jgi:hypothetical protein
MNVTDAREIVQAAQVDPLYYSFDADRHEALCILAYGQVWRVFLSERGQHYEEKEFSTEDEACTYFLKRLFDLWSTK